MKKFSIFILLILIVSKYVHKFQILIKLENSALSSEILFYYTILHGENWKRFGKVDLVGEAASQFLQEVGPFERILCTYSGYF